MQNRLKALRGKAFRRFGEGSWVDIWVDIGLRENAGKPWYISLFRG